jgi:hypothetical protein
MPLTVDNASDNIAFVIINLVTDNLKNPDKIQENEDNAMIKFSAELNKIVKRSFKLATLKKLCALIKVKLIGYVEITRDIPDVFIKGSIKPTIPMTKLKQIREKMAEDAINCFVSFSKGTILDLEVVSEPVSNDKGKKSRKNRSKGGNTSRKNYNK